MDAITKPSEKLCPLCGGDNQCAVAAGDNPAGCWCAGEQFPAELRTRDAARHNPSACICRGCLEHAGHER